MSYNTDITYELLKKWWVEGEYNYFSAHFQNLKYHDLFFST